MGRSLQLTSGEGLGHDEIDMEFMHNKSGEPVVLNTNVRANSDGKKEQQFYSSSTSGSTRPPTIWFLDLTETVALAWKASGGDC